MIQGKQKSFTTSYGRTIQFWDDYFEVHENVKPKEILAWLRLSNPEDTEQRHDKKNDVQNRNRRVYSQEGFVEFTKSVVQRLAGIEAPPLFYTKDVFIYSMMADFLIRHGVNCQWENSLDIGGAEGFVSRLLKAEGMVKKAVCVDIIDMQEKSSHIRQLQKDFRAQVMLRNFDALSGHHSRNFGFFPPVGHKFWNIKFSHSPDLDEYIADDFLTIKGSFDFISGLAVIPYFELDELFDRLSSLLRPGGIFFCLVDYWWWPVNSTRICGHFPYASQRLNAEDFKRYVKEFHSLEADDIIMKYNYYHKGKQRPTISDYLDYGWRAGFEPIGYERLMPSEKPHPKTPLPPKALEQFKEFSMEDVLTDIHCFKTDVKLEDLHTAFAMFAMTKKERATKSFCITK